MPRRPHYRKNPQPSRRAALGRAGEGECFDDIDGHWTYKCRTVINEDGLRVDATNRDTLDFRPDLDFGNGPSPQE